MHIALKIMEIKGKRQLYFSLGGHSLTFPRQLTDLQKHVHWSYLIKFKVLQLHQKQK